jgi:Ser/Thr protein kinase RdoA (MazF antagonist)
MTLTPSNEDYFSTAQGILSQASIDVAMEPLVSMLRQVYGMTGMLQPLSSEAERTTRFHPAETGPLILKTSSRREALESFHFQAAVLAGIESGTGFVTPRVIRTISGELRFCHEGMHGYLQTCLDGTLLTHMDAGPDLLRSVGEALGHIDAALRDVTVPAANRPVLWNIQCWPMLPRLGHHLSPDAVAEHACAAMRHYLDQIQPELAKLDWQVTHNDPSPHNILVTNSGIGFIDFSDGGWAPRIQDLAVAASHFVTNPATSLGGAEALIKGYNAVMPLSPLEAKLLVGLMRARQAALILVNSWRATLFPAEAGYINKNVARAARGLSILAALSDTEAEAAVHAAIR